MVTTQYAASVQRSAPPIGGQTQLSAINGSSTGTGKLGNMLDGKPHEFKKFLNDLANRRHDLARDTSVHRNGGIKKNMSIDRATDDGNPVGYNFGSPAISEYESPVAVGPATGGSAASSHASGSVSGGSSAGNHAESKSGSSVEIEDPRSFLPSGSHAESKSGSAAENFGASGSYIPSEQITESYGVNGQIVPHTAQAAVHGINGAETVSGTPQAFKIMDLRALKKGDMAAWNEFAKEMSGIAESVLQDVMRECSSGLTEDEKQQISAIFARFFAVHGKKEKLTKEQEEMLKDLLEDVSENYGSGEAAATKIAEIMAALESVAEPNTAPLAGDGSVYTDSDSVFLKITSSTLTVTTATVAMFSDKTPAELEKILSAMGIQNAGVGKNSDTAGMSEEDDILEQLYEILKTDKEKQAELKGIFQKASDQAESLLSQFTAMAAARDNVTNALQAGQFGNIREGGGSFSMLEVTQSTLEYNEMTVALKNKTPKERLEAFVSATESSGSESSAASETAANTPDSIAAYQNNVVDMSNMFAQLFSNAETPTAVPAISEISEASDVSGISAVLSEELQPPAEVINAGESDTRQFRQGENSFISQTADVKNQTNSGSGESGRNFSGLTQDSANGNTGGGFADNLQVLKDGGDGGYSRVSVNQNVGNVQAEAENAVGFAGVSEAEKSEKSEKSEESESLRQLMSGKTDGIHSDTVKLKQVEPTSYLRHTVAGQIGEKIVAHLTPFENGVKEFTMTLAPETLGKVAIRIVSEAGKTSVFVTAERAETGAILAQRGENLSAALREHGIKLDKYQVVTENEKPDSYNDGRQNDRQHQQQEREQEQEPGLSRVSGVFGNLDEEPEISFEELLQAM